MSRSLTQLLSLAVLLPIGTILTVGPASAYKETPFALLDASVSPHQQQKFGDRVECYPDALLCFKVALHNKWHRPFKAKCEIPMIGFSREYLVPANDCVLVCIPVKVLAAGTYQPTVYMTYPSFYTGLPVELHQTLTVYCLPRKDHYSAVDPFGEKLPALRSQNYYGLQPGTGAGQQQGGLGGQQGGVGASTPYYQQYPYQSGLGGQQQGGFAGQQQGGFAGQQQGGFAGQQQGGFAGQQQGGFAGQQQDGFAGQQQGGGQQQGSTPKYGGGPNQGGYYLLSEEEDTSLKPDFSLHPYNEPCYFLGSKPQGGVGTYPPYYQQYPYQGGLGGQQQAEVGTYPPYYQQYPYQGGFGGQQQGGLGGQQGGPNQGGYTGGLGGQQQGGLGGQQQGGLGGQQGPVQRTGPVQGGTKFLPG